MEGSSFLIGNFVLTTKVIQSLLMIVLTFANYIPIYAGCSKNRIRIMSP